eukprot:COSAG06_NODE_10156_length_1738_cov_4.849908_3_plen_91_part_01
MTAPLTDMLKKGVNFKETWSATQDEAVAKIKTALTMPVWTVSKCRKLRGKYVGSFLVVAVHSPIAIEVRLPSWLHKNIHPVFHPMYLKLSD